MIHTSEIEYCKVEVDFLADPKKVSEKRHEVFLKVKEANKKRPLPGFRPNKAPDHVIKLHLKKQIDDLVTQEMVSNAVDEYLFESKAKLVFYPQVQNYQLDDSHFSCKMIVLKRPEFELGNYKEMEIPKPHQPISALQMSEMMLNNMRGQYADFSPYQESDFVQAGDKVVISTNVMIDGQKNEELSKEADVYEVGGSDFDNEIIGMNAEEERTFNLILKNPEELTGKTATYNVKVQMGMKKVLPDLNDEFAQKVGFETFEKLNEALNGMATNRINSIEQSTLNQQISKKLLEMNDFQIPQWLLQAEAHHIAINMKSNFDNLSPEYQQMILDQAKDSVRLALILDKIREEEPECVVTDQELVEVLKRRVVENGQNPNEFLLEAQKNGSLLGMLAALKNEVVMQWLMKNIKIVE